MIAILRNYHYNEINNEINNEIINDINNKMLASSNEQHAIPCLNTCYEHTRG